MIRVEIFEKNKTTIGYALKGHAGYAKDGGPDIVCAAVSMAIQMTLNGIEHFTSRVTRKEKQEDGLLVASFEGVSKMPRVMALTKSFNLAIKDLEEQYPHNIKVDYMVLTMNEEDV